MTDHSIRHQYLKTSFIIVMVASLVACGGGIRIKNWVNYPIEIKSFETLDTLKVSPEIVKFMGPEVRMFRSLNEDIRIQGRHDARTLWIGNEKGCLSINDAAQVYISDFNFQGRPQGETLISVQSGKLILENCSFRTNDLWAIEVGPNAMLELMNVDFAVGGEGALQVNGGYVKIYDSRFVQAGKTAIQVTQANLFEIHSTVITNTMGTGLEINGTEEVWLDSVRVLDSFQDGIAISDCDYVLINQVESRENGRNGLAISDAKICGILNLSALGNLVNGIDLSGIDTLRMVNSELVGNGESGGLIMDTPRSRMAGVRVGHNGSDGLTFTRGEEIWINRSSFQANPQKGLGLDSLRSIKAHQLSFVNNGQGLQTAHFDSLEIDHSLFSSNKTSGLSVSSGVQTEFSRNLIKNNRTGLQIEDVLLLELDSNHVEGNALGSDIKSISNILSTHNEWISNTSGAYFSDIGSMSSRGDKWRSNLDTGLEIFSATELLINAADFRNNRKGALFNKASLSLTSSNVDSSRDVGLTMMNGSMIIEKSGIKQNGLGVLIAEGSRATISQCSFSHNEQQLKAEASVSLTFTFSSMSNSGTGMNLGNYIEASILSSKFDLIEGPAIMLSGPHTQSVLFRQNVISRSGGVLNSNARSGSIVIQSNTFANNTLGIQGRSRTLTALDHNIFYHTPRVEPQILRDSFLYKWNCLFPVPTDDRGDQEATNIISDPLFGEKYYLQPNSPCLNGGDNGLLIGALGAVPIVRPNLKP